MKIVFSLLLLITSSVSFSQNELPNDWVINELKGEIRRVIINEFHDNPKSQPTKKILNFDKSGLLTTTSEYNAYYVEDDSIALSDIIYYKNKASRRYFYRYDIEKKDTTMTGFYENAGENRYLLKTENKDGYNTSTYSWMDNGNITKSNRIIYDHNNDIIADLTMTYNYNKDKLLNISVINNTNETKKEQLLSIESIKDENGNIINQIYYNEDGKIYLEITRKLYYYD